MIREPNKAKAKGSYGWSSNNNKLPSWEHVAGNVAPTKHGAGVLAEEWLHSHLPHQPFALPPHHSSAIEVGATCVGYDILHLLGSHEFNSYLEWGNTLDWGLYIHKRKLIEALVLGSRSDTNI